MGPGEGLEGARALRFTSATEFLYPHICHERKETDVKSTTSINLPTSDIGFNGKFFLRAQEIHGRIERFFNRSRWVKYNADLLRRKEARIMMDEGLMASACFSDCLAPAMWIPGTTPGA